jgi:hypothetical protein
MKPWSWPLSVIATLHATACSMTSTPAGLSGGDLGGSVPSSAPSAAPPASGAPAASPPPVLGAPDAGFDAAPASPGVPSDQCSEASKLVYVVSRDNVLYSFAPATVTFSRVGVVACPSEASEFPFSMAVDRAGTAWVLFTDGNLFNVSTKDATCSRTSFLPNQAGFSLFGMGFVSDGPDASTDTLYVSENVNGHGLGKLELPSLVLSAVGGYSGALAGQKAELTGNGKGDLYGFFLTTPAEVAPIGTTSAVVASATPLPSVTVGTDWAFSYWGGAFYLYTGNSTDTAQNGSAVTRYDPADGSVTVLSSGVGFFITGAGVSTCAPTVAPPPPPPPPPPPAPK